MTSVSESPELVIDVQPKDSATADDIAGEECAQSESIGPYEILEPLGSGGMGAVYKVRHKGAGNLLALKILHQELAADPINVKRFQQELKTTNLLNHPNVVPIFDNGVAEDGRPYFVMEYLDGLNLEELLKAEGYLDLERFFNVFGQVCDALSHLHGKRVIHRDLKPSNIMVRTTDSGYELVKILDFGVARVFQQASKEGVRLTQLGEILGSPTYMSPEQCFNQKLDERSDIYALGVVMYEALAGTAPFTGDSAAHVIMGHLQEKPKSISKMRPDFNISADLEALVMACLEKEPQLRYQSFADISEELKRILVSAKARSLKGILRCELRRAKIQMERTAKRIFESRRKWAIPAVTALTLAGAGVCAVDNWINNQSYKTYIERAEVALLDSRYDEVISDWQAAIHAAERAHMPPIELATLNEEAGDDVLSEFQLNARLGGPIYGFEYARQKHRQYTNGTIDLVRRQAASEFYAHALKTYDKVNIAGDEHSKILAKLIDLAAMSGDIKTEEVYLKQRLSYESARNDNQARFELAKIYESTGRMDETEDMLKEIARLEQNSGGWNALDKLTDFYQRQNKLDLAEQALGEELELVRRQSLHGGDYSNQIGQLLSKLSLILRDQGKTQEAAVAYGEAQELLKPRTNRLQ